MDREAHWINTPSNPSPFQRVDLQSHDLQPLHRNRWGQARVVRGRLAGEDWVIKDFGHSHLVRWLWGRWLLARELRALQRLERIPGIPTRAFRLDRDAIGYRYTAGDTLRDLRNRHDIIDGRFFQHLEVTIDQMHDRGVAHLDLGNLRNILVTRDSRRPHVIDFGSCVFLEHVPAVLARRLCRIDRSRLYKAWSQLSPDTLGTERAEYLADHYHQHHSKPKHWGRQMSHTIREFFHNPSLRRWFRKLRLPLGIAFLVLVMSQIQLAWYWPGAVMALCGALLQAWSFACIDTQTVLANKGPYSLVRNPQYLTRFLLVIGVVLMTGNVWLVLVTSVLYYFYAVTRVEREEALLPDIFGASYRHYCDTVPRFLPRLGNLSGERLWHWNWHAFAKNHGATNLATVVSVLVLLYAWALYRG